MIPNYDKRIPTLVLSVLLLISFFLPWIEVHWLTGRVTYSAWELLKILGQAEELAAEVNRYAYELDNSFFVLYALPALSLLQIYISIIANYKYLPIIQFLIIMVIGCVFYKFVFELNIGINYTGIGLWGTYTSGAFVFYTGAKAYIKSESKLNIHKPIILTLLGIAMLSILYIVWNAEPISKEIYNNQEPYKNPYPNRASLPKDDWHAIKGDTINHQTK